MNKLINNDTDLRRYIPNQVVAVKGEASLFDKITHWLYTAEQWIFATFCPSSVIDAILADKSLSAFHATLAAVAAHRALADAIPSLDLVQTVNGFAVISNQNLAPASRDRVDRLIAAHRSQCDTAISALIPQLAAVAEWRDTPPCDYFRSTLFPTPAHIRPLASGAATWERYEELHPAIVAAEDRLAAEYISPDLMQRLRDEALGLSQLSTLDARLCEALRAHVADIIQDRPLRNTVLSDIVDYIRRHPDTFPEWHRSDTARLFSPPVFRNSKQSPGYWF
ncbi:hypothetical protein ED328_07630 [Muribaculaceae bacterium Isolate-001 (NCI)]|jgi:hypothetical protein|uniref:DUF6712 family protein n=1 Tax=uncultured Muribaculum sp. TaxID=1918613 RepID=UPI000FFF151A|nr:DUF6712 family protein [uncultured Muribaculum sp.]RXE68297.1 hypothetical protein ED328_07630 [Muribaculaceae bacterium Isolate-001 (NCI)]